MVESFPQKQCKQDKLSGNKTLVMSKETYDNNHSMCPSQSSNISIWRKYSSSVNQITSHLHTTALPPLQQIPSETIGQLWSLVCWRWQSVLFI